MSGPVLDVSGVSVRFGGLQALDHVSLRVGEGEIVGVLGPNGAGKTTLFNAIGGFVDLAGGRVTLLSTDVTHLSPDRRARFGLVRTFQALRVFDHLSVYENVLVGFHRRWAGGPLADALGLPVVNRERTRLRDAAAELLEFMGIAEYAAAAPADVPFGVLRRVEVARALAAQPRLLLLDEPASGLHAHERAELTRVVARLPRERAMSVLLVEHDVDLVMRLADSICVLDFGRVIATGSPQAIRSDPDVQRAYLGSLA